MSADDEVDLSIKIICPSISALSVIINEAKCKECNLVFNSESQLWMHDVKVHQKKNLDKSSKQNVRYHCPVEECIYGLTGSKYFNFYKYLKQHYLKVHAEKVFKCPQCTKSFSTNAVKEAHARTCGITFVCECQKVYNTYDSLLTHAKRNSHSFDEKYKPKRVKKNNTPKSAIVPRSILQNQSIIVIDQSVNVPILPKPTCEVAIQTEESQIKRKTISPKVKKSRTQVCRQTQTTETAKEKQNKKSTETQTAKAVPRLIRVSQVGKRKKDPALKLDENLIQTLASEYLQPYSPYSLRHDIILEDFWEEKSTTSGTQTSPEKNGFTCTENYSAQNDDYKGITRSDPMLNEDAYANKFSSIETQTEKAYCRSIFETDSLNTNNETQTTDNFTEAMDPLQIYNTTCTQTCDEILSSDLVFSDIQTQTAWSHLDETTAVSTETQTKAFKCLAGCSDSSSWFTIQRNHMETQTDLFNNIFDDVLE